MKTLDYSDFYKFIVSTGVVLISLAVLFPWLLLREPFDISLKAAEITEFTTVAQSIVSIRQTTALWFLSNVRFISGALALFGVIFLGWGLFEWNRMQKLRDKREFYETEKARRELEPMSPEQIAQKAVVDIIEERQEAEEQALPIDILIPASTALTQHFRIEKLVQDKLRACFRNDGEILTNRRIKSAEYDVVLQSKTKTLPDAIFEIKYASKGFKINWVRESVNRLILATELYSSTSGRHAISVILFVSPEATINKIPTDIYKNRVVDETEKLGAKIRMHFISEEDLDFLECAQLYSMVFAEYSGG